MRSLPGVLCAALLPSLSACQAVVNFDGYQFLEPEKACDGSPAYTDPQGDRGLRLFNDEALGLPAEQQQFSFACLLDRSRLNMCEDSASLMFTGVRDTVIGGSGVIPPSDFSLEPARVQLVAPETLFVFVTVDTSRRNVELSVEAPKADIVISSLGVGLVSVRAIGFTVGVYADGDVDLLQVDAASVAVGAQSVFVLGPIPAAANLDLGPGAIRVEECYTIF
jgi:hypothetical protein